MRSAYLAPTPFKVIHEGDSSSKVYLPKQTSIPYKTRDIQMFSPKLFTNCIPPEEDYYYRNTSVKYANGIYVMGRQSNGTAYSMDGITWHNSQGDWDPTYNSIICLEHANGIWVASTQVGLYYSEDGITWGKSNAPTNWFDYCTYANGIWLAGGYHRTGTYYSTDGKTWTPCSPCYTTVYATYANGLWVACIDEVSMGALAYSTDGINWTVAPGTTDLGTIFKCCCYGNNKWVACGKYWSPNYDGCRLYYSTDGINWSPANNELSFKHTGFDQVYFNNGVFIARSTSNNTQTVSSTIDGVKVYWYMYAGLYWSIDGVNWNHWIVDCSDLYGEGSITNPGDSLRAPANLTYTGSVWIACDVGSMYISKDGKHWTKLEFWGEDQVWFLDTYYLYSSYANDTLFILGEAAEDSTGVAYFKPKHPLIYKFGGELKC